MLFDAKLPKQFWGEAILCANYLQNRLYNSAVNSTPYFLLYGKKPPVDHLRIFGCEAWVLIPRAQRRKGGVKSRKKRFCGYQPNTKGWRFIESNHNQTRIVVSRNAEFCEQNGWTHLHANPDILDEAEDAETDSNEEPSNGPAGKAPTIAKREEIVKQKFPSPRETLTSPRRDGKCEGEDSYDKVQPEIVQPRRSERSNKGKPPERFSAISVRVCFANCEPESYQEVLTLPVQEVDLWHKAMKKEMESLKDLGVYTITTLPAGERAVGCRWVYRIKKSVDGETQYKARLVARGFTQTKDVHYTEVYSPTARAESMRMLLAIAAQRGFVVNHFDV